MGRRIAAADWSASPIGPPASWPAALRSAVALTLPAHAEIVLFWGADYVAIYNDACAAGLGNKHPGALGRPARESWGELWDELEPLLTHVRLTGETVSGRDRPFRIDRAGYEEDVFFDISYSPIALDDGSVGGVLCIVSETTHRLRDAWAVQAQRDDLQQMFDQAPGFMAMLREPGHVFELANATYRRMTGDRPLIGLPYAEALPEVAEQGFLARLDEMARTGEPFRGDDVPIRLPTSTPGVTTARWLDFICQPITDARGTVTGIFIEGTDRTERHKAERALALSRNSLELATEAAEIGTWNYDMLRDRFTCSPRALEMYGLPPGAPALTREQFAALLHPDDVPLVRDAFVAAVDPAARAMFDVEYRVPVGTDGAVRWLSVKGRGLFEGDTCVRTIGTLVDITPRKLEAEALRESEERFRMLADSLPALVWVTDAEGNITFASHGFQTMLGVAPQSVMDDGWIVLLRPDQRALATERRRSWMQAPIALSGEHPIQARNGEERWFHAEARPRFLGRTFQGYIACAIDVTEAHLAGERLEARVAERTAELRRQIAERERVEETLHQMQRLEAVGQLTSGVAHDFNNLLTVVLGNVDALALAARRGTLEAQITRRLDYIRAAAERGATLTAQLLAFSRRQRLEAKVIDLNDSVLGLTDLLGSTLGRLIAIETQLADAVWPALVDPTQIELIILNLAINARDAMPNGGTLTVSTANVTRGEPEGAEEPPPGDYVCVKVADTGTGMGEAVLARVFEPFFTTKEVGKGSGLGLAQVYGFAKQSGGGVRIDSVVGEGTAVSVFLPRAAEAVAPAVEPAVAPATTSLDGRTVLVLDDEDRVRAVAVETLREAGCRVIEAGDGDSALAALAHEPAIELVVADVAMPGMTGVEFAQRAQLVHPALPVLFVTGYVDLAAIVDVPEERLIRKPYARRVLLERVRALLADD